MNNLVKTSTFPNMGYKFSEFNPFQSQFYPHKDDDKNVVIAAQTGSGKSVIAELCINSSITNGARAIFLAPMRALVQEKYDDWTKEGHTFKQYGVSILSGDYKLTDAKKKELLENKIIVMTSEMLDSRSRRMKTEGNVWLLETTTLIIDEAHIIGMLNQGEDSLKARGHKLEAAIMRFTNLNPNCRIVLLSATLPNLPQLGEWLTKLNNKETITIVSDWRPQPLEWHVETYQESSGYGSYHINKSKMFQKAEDVIKQYPKDMWLIFCHSKNDGRRFVNQISDSKVINPDGETIPFHCADLEKGERVSLENGFRTKSAKIMVATSTLAYGVNLPARRVMILDDKRGLSPVHPYDIKQMGGRAGRPGIDPRGDVHWIVGDRSASEADFLINNMPEAKSQMFDLDTFAFHVVAEIAEGDITNAQGVWDFYNRCLARHQGAEVSKEWVTQLVEKLIEVNAIKVLEDGLTLKATGLGRVASWLYFSPFDIWHWYNNLRILVESKRTDDAAIAWMWSCVRSNGMNYIPKDCQDEVRNFQNELSNLGPCRSAETMALGIWLQLKGTENKDFPSGCIAMARNYIYDTERVAQALILIDKMYAKLDADNFIKQCAIRVSYGVGWDAAKLCMLPGIGKKRSENLISNGIKSREDLMQKEKVGRAVLGDKIYEKALEIENG